MNSHFANDATEALGKRPIPWLLLSYSLPAMLGLIAIALYETIDRIFVGQFVGNEGLAIMAVGMPYVILLTAFCVMLRIGGSSVISRFLGEGDQKMTEKALGTSFALLAAGGILLAVAGNLFAPAIARISGATEQMLLDTAQYIMILSTGAPFLFIGNGANALMRATGSPRKGLGLIVSSCVANVLLDFLFVAYWEWGVPGAAWATVLSQALGAGYGIWHFTRPTSPVRLYWQSLGFTSVLVREIIGVGFAYAMFELNFLVVVTLANHMLESYGSTLALASVAVVNSCVTILYMPVTGLDEGLQPIIGYNFGAKNRERVVKATKYALGIGLVFFLVIFSIIQVGAEYVVAVFIDDNPEFIAMTANALRLTFILAPLMAFMIVIPGILSALGEARFNFILSVAIQFVVQIPALLLLPRWLGINGVWLTFPLVDMVAAILGSIFLYKSFRRHGLLIARSTKV
ncbi:MAG TPA: MATE family efflux transporter [Patescibacteria group bacterium]|nr:MATE family efflux transporter [Patescibacteria group bacterium]